MSFTISLDGSVSYVADGPYAIVGTGTDGIGPFTLKGTVTKNGDLDVTKTYNVKGQTWSWRYQGLYDSAGAIGGIWREINDDAASPRGSFQLTQQQALPKVTAQAIIPQGRALTTASTSPTVSGALQALQSKGTKVPSATLQTLQTGFGNLV